MHIKYWCQKEELVKKGSGIGLGMIFGVAIGIATDNIGLWIALGIVFGSAYETRIAASKKKEGETDSE